MFQIGDLVEHKEKNKLIGLVVSMIDGKYGIKWLNTDEYDRPITIYTNTLDYLRKIDSIDERGIE